ncbi:filaggrin-2 [Mirounga angustirostris]|uniref:filaggrin-2 n=1 Tax=Mirounga angustirostris TaxID=9716 RepID=UPI00313BAB4F
MTDLLRSVVTVIDVFYKYTKQDGECGTLSKDELKELLEKEFRPILKNPDDPDTVDVIMHMLDRDHDRRLDFTEFLLMVFKLAMACNKVLSKEYCKASGSKKHSHGHRHQKEESETEEEEEDTTGQKSGYRYSSWSEGEEYGYDSEGLRESMKHRHGSNSRRLGKQGGLSSSGNQEQFEKRHHGSSSGHSWSSGKERHGSSSGELGERRNKSHVSPSRESEKEYESGSGSKSRRRKGRGGLSHGLDASGDESNSTQSRNSGGQKLGSSSRGSGDDGRQSYECGSSNSGGCGRPQNASTSCQEGRFGGQGNQSSCTQSGYQSGSSGGLGRGCISGGQSSGYGQHEPRSCSQSSSQREYGSRACDQTQNCGRQQRTGSSQSSCCEQYGSVTSQSSSYGQYGSGSYGHFSNSQQKGSGSNEFAKCGQHGFGSGQSSGFGQHGSSSGQSSGFGQQGSGSGQSSSFGQRGSSSGQASGFDQHGSGSGQSSGFGQHGYSSSQSSSFGQQGSGSGQSSGFYQHGLASGQSSSFGEHGSGPGESFGFGQHGSGEHQSSSSGQHRYGSGQPSSFGYGSSKHQYHSFGTGSGHSLGFGQHESRSGQSSYGQHGSSSEQSSNIGSGSSSGRTSKHSQYGSNSSQSSGYDQHESTSGHSSGYDKYDSRIGEQETYGTIKQEKELKGDREEPKDSQETKVDMPSLVMDKPPGQNLVGLQEGDLVSVTPVTLKDTQESCRHTQDPLMATLDFNMESQNPQPKGHREQLMHSQETPVEMLSLGMDNPPGQNPLGLQEGDQVSVSLVTLKGTQESHRQTQDPLMPTLDLNMESHNPQLKGDRKLPMDSQETPDMLSPGMGKQLGPNPVGLQEEDLVSVSPVTLKGTQESHRNMQDPLKTNLDLHMESQDPQLKGHGKKLKDSQETPLDMHSLVTDKPPGQNPVELQEGDPVSVSPVTLKGTQESHRHTQDPLEASLDLNMESQDPQLKRDRELLMDSQETLDMPGLGMEKITGQNLLGLQEGDPVSVSLVTPKSTQESHRHMQDRLEASLDLNMKSQDPQLKGHRKKLKDSQETPLDMHSLVMDKPPGQNPVELQEGDPVSVSPVTLKGTQESHRHTQDPLEASLDLNMESQDP